MKKLSKKSSVHTWLSVQDKKKIIFVLWFYTFVVSCLSLSMFLVLFLSRLESNVSSGYTPKERRRAFRFAGSESPTHVAPTTTALCYRPGIARKPSLIKNNKSV